MYQQTHNTTALGHVHVAWLHAASFPEPDPIHDKEDSGLREKDHRHQTTQECWGRLLLVLQTEVKGESNSLFFIFFTACGNLQF